MTKREFISGNKLILTAIINQLLHNPTDTKISNSEIEIWLLNNEELYNWARRSGVRI